MSYSIPLYKVELEGIRLDLQDRIAFPLGARVLL